MHACIYCVASVRCEQHSTGKAMPDLYESERREGIRNLVTALDKVVAVNSFFITAAYGTYFGVWAIFRDHVEPAFILLSGVLLIVSATIFASWHVVNALTMTAVVTAIPNPGMPGYAARWRFRFGLATMILTKRHYFAATMASLIPALAALALFLAGHLRTL